MTGAACPRCGAAFDCGAHAGGCWCGAVEVSAAARAHLAAAYDGCLCPGCLDELATTPGATLARDRRSSREDV